MTASILYKGNLRCIATHLQSGSEIETDAPTDNHGKGERFSPTDLLCVSLGTCMITTIGIKTKDLNINLKDTSLEITKHMLNDPRRVGQIDVTVKFLTTLSVDEQTKMIIERIGDNCPVAKSLHPEIKLHLVYQWG